ncbi:hypothetical protein RYX36_027116 [Vicia faba]
MGRYRSRSRSYSPRRRSRTPPRGRKRYDDERYPDTRSRRDRRSPLPSGLLVRNLPLDARENMPIPQWGGIFFLSDAMFLSLNRILN